MDYEEMGMSAAAFALYCFVVWLCCLASSIVFLERMHARRGRQLERDQDEALAIVAEPKNRP